MMPLSFAHTPENPYHFSVGAVIQGPDGRILCHHYADVPINPIRPQSLYLLMRETLEPGESPETALARGAMEEFGATVRPIRFLGSLLCSFQEKGTQVEKATAYVLCELETLEPAKRNDDPENQSNVEWQDKEFLIKAMRVQVGLAGRSDADESAILERL
jgi:hypothetical protein